MNGCQDDSFGYVFCLQLLIYTIHQLISHGGREDDFNMAGADWKHSVPQQCWDKGESLIRYKSLTQMDGVLSVKIHRVYCKERRKIV